ncbi:MAG: hypothetical protein GF381_04320 [Candidatus Pacebacteria bacterium]|nr:hypothetical protein [Candidatus Paceibacterota bacterium]
MDILLKKQEALQKQAFEVIAKLNLREILGKYGEFELVGSIEYGLMTWRDIDANLIFEKDPSDGEFWKIVKQLFASPEVKSLTIVDNRNQTEENRPRSMYVGIKHKDNRGETWKIDLRLIARDQVTTDKISKLINEKITEETRKIILKIKSQVHDNSKYHIVFSSVDIYEAVLLKEVSNLSGFEEYLSVQGKSL